MLVSSLLHRDLSNPVNKTNVHAHHMLPYKVSKGDSRGDLDLSFFRSSPDSDELFYPFDEKTHKPFSIARFLESKLRWMTLGGQYDWTLKKYPTEQSPQLPSDIAKFVHTLFPDIYPEAAIMNIYKPGDYLSMHRDVSEECDNALVSISLGCDGIFMAGLQPDKESETRCITLRLHSGDCVYLGG